MDVRQLVRQNNMEFRAGTLTARLSSLSFHSCVSHLDRNLPSTAGLTNNGWSADSCDLEMRQSARQFLKYNASYFNSHNT